MDIVGFIGTIKIYIFNDSTITCFKSFKTALLLFFFWFVETITKFLNLWAVGFEIKCLYDAVNRSFFSKP